MEIKKIIIVSGTGASGSSALFDYFKCFPNVCGIVRELKPEIARGVYRDWKRDNFKNIDKYKLKLKEVLDTEIEKEFGETFTGILLLNNTVSCLNLKCLELFDNANVFCVLRDPRTTWIAWEREWVDKNGDRKWSKTEDPVGSFIASYKRCMNRFCKGYLSTKYFENIHVVNFEDFVLDAGLRQLYVNLMGFDLSKCSSKPENEFHDINKTIFAHKNYSNQEIISRIKTELSMYCHPKV